MTMRELHDWVAHQKTVNPGSANRVLNACNGVIGYWSKQYVLTPKMGLAASLSAMELQRVVEIHNEGRNPDLLAA